MQTVGACVLAPAVSPTNTMHLAIPSGHRKRPGVPSRRPRKTVPPPSPEEVIVITCASYIASARHSEHSDNRGRVAETELEVVLREGLRTGSSSASYEQLAD
jgi:hypothetical protein